MAEPAERSVGRNVSGGFGHIPFYRIQARQSQFRWKGLKWVDRLEFERTPAWSRYKGDIMGSSETGSSEAGTGRVNETIRATLRDHGNLMTSVEELADDTDLYDAGLTSMATVTVMLALEDGFDIEFPESVLSRKTFSSIASIQAAVADFLPA
jgi:acyl carrier protein